jgi:hypothetical protein
VPTNPYTRPLTFTPAPEPPAPPVGGSTSRTLVMPSQTQLDRLGANPFAPAVGFVGNQLATVTQPFNAGQQVLFGAVGELQGKTGSFWRGLQAAGSYLTFGLVNPDARLNAISGRELIENADAKAPEWLKRWGGLSLDVLADPGTLLGGVGLAGKIAGKAGKVAALERGGVSLINAGNVMNRLAVPEIFRALPKAAREGAARATTDLLWNREIATGSTFASITGRAKASIAELFLPEELQLRLLPQADSERLLKMREVRKSVTELGREYEDRKNAVFETFKQATAGLGKKTTDEADRILSRMLGARTRGDYLKAKGDLLTAVGGDQQKFDALFATYRAGVGFDYWSGNVLVNLGLLTEETLQKNIAFPHPNLGTTERRGSIRRVWLLYGQDGEDWIRSINERANPASVTVDPGKLEQFVLNYANNRKVRQVNPFATPQVQQMQAGLGAKDQAFAAGIQADPSGVRSTIENLLKAKPDAKAVDLVAEVVKNHGLDAQRTRQLVNQLLGDRRSAGVLYRRADKDLARELLSRREEATSAGSFGELGVNRSAIKQQSEIPEEVWDDLGQMESMLAQYEEQASRVGQLAMHKQALTEIRDYLESGNLIQKAGTEDDALFLDRLNRGGQSWRRLTADETKQMNGLFHAGEIVPTWAHRTITAGQRVGGRGGWVTLQRGVSMWKTVKLSNPASVVRNIVGNVALAEEYGITPVEMAYGIIQYIRKSGTEAGQLELRNAGIADGLLTRADIQATTKRIRSRRSLSNRKENPLERAFDYLEDFLGTSGRTAENIVGEAEGLAKVGAAVAAYNPAKLAFAAFGKMEEVSKGAIYYAGLKSGLDPAKAADLANDAIFDYTVRPLAVDFASKTGLDAFGTFRVLSNGRTLVNLYERPIRTARVLRIPQAINQGQADQTQLRHEAQALPDWLAAKLPIRLGEDEHGRGYYLPFQTLLPGGGIPFIGGWFQLPGIAQYAREAFEGLGFRGSETYRGMGGGTLNQALKVDPNEAARRFLKVTLNFIGYPWQPGSSMMERASTALAANAYSADEIAEQAGVDVDEFEQAHQSWWLKFMRDGVTVLAPNSQADDLVAPWVGKKHEPAQNTLSALGRLAGITTYPVQGDIGEIGKANSDVKSAQYAYNERLTYWRDRIKAAHPSDHERLKADARADLAARAAELKKLVEGYKQ